MPNQSPMRVLPILAAAAALACPCANALGITFLPERYRTTVRGDFVLIGNTLGFDAAPGVPAPIVGVVGATGINTTDNAPDVYWRSNAPVNGQAQANTSITGVQARSQAVLAIPPGATVKHARLYWAAVGTTPLPDTQVTLSRTGAGAFTTTVTADGTATSTGNAYQATADVTALVQAFGPGAYQLSDADIAPFVDLNNAALFAGWSMVVVYSRPTDPPREIIVHDGLGFVSQAGPVQALMNRVQPLAPSGVNARLGVVAYEGDTGVNMDFVRLNGGTPLSDALNPLNNFFNGTRGFLGSSVSVAGDLPQLTGTPGSMCGIDIDVVDITASAPGPGVVTVSCESSASGGDQYQAGVVVMSVTVPVVCVGDINQDGLVNTADLALFLGFFGQSVPAFTNGDLNGDGVVNTLDLTLFLAAFGTACP